MKTKSVIPEKDNVLKIAPTITTTPIAGTFYAIYPNPDTIVFSYISSTTIYANLWLRVEVAVRLVSKLSAYRRTP